MKHKKHSAPRQQRIADQIRRDLADLIHHEINDPRIKQITLTEVDVSSDYSFAKVYFTTLYDDQLEGIIKALAGSAGFLRSQLNKRIRLYQIPKLLFLYDVSVQRGMHLSRLIDQANAHTSHDPLIDEAAETTPETPPAATDSL